MITSSIIIVNHQTKDFLKKCLSSISRLISGGESEIIVIDNNSADESVDMVKRDFPEVKLICLDENAGFSRANNIGIKNSKGKYLIFLNSDTEVDPSVIEGLIGYLEGDRKIGAVGCRQLDSNGNLQLSFGKFPTFYREIIRKFMHFRLLANDRRTREYVETKYNGEVDVDWLSGSCIAIPREVMEQVGVFDPAFFMYFEDIDLCHRIKQAGWRVCYNSHFTTLHHGGITTRQDFTRSYLEHRKSQLHFCKKYYGLKGLIALKILVFMKFLFLSIKSSLLFISSIFLKEKRQRAYNELLLCKKMFEMALKGRTEVSR